jgi:uncharacterized protein DUF4382
MTFNIMSEAARILRRTVQVLGAPALLLALAACGGGSSMGGNSMVGPQGCSAPSCGTAMITLTDAPGDFTSYTVDITSLTLVKESGAVVETLPVTTHVDLTKLVNLSELLSASTVPEGEYVAATMTVDFTHASVFVEVNGAPVQATLVDGSGKPLTTLALTVKLDDTHHLVISPGVIARLALDFNVAASNSVDITKTPPVVTVQPFIVASLEESDTRSLRVRGTLVSVDTSAASYVVNVHPFDEDDKDDVGQVTVHTNAQTSFEVNGAPSTGPAGITALAALTPGAWTVAFGTVSTTDHTFSASQVLAGSSVVMPSMDTLIGVVISRTGSTLMVRGASLWMEQDELDHYSAKDVALTIGSGTMFTVEGQPSAAPTMAWPSVGSRLTAFGTAAVDSSGNPTFDATAGRVRLETTTIWGFASANASSQVTINLQAIEGLPTTTFNFAGTGTTSAQDSSPLHYVVTTGALPPPAVSATSAVRFLGLVQPFGSAPPDFNANTLVNYASAIALLDVSFGVGSANAFSTVSATDLVLNLADPLLGTVHTIRIGPQTIDLKTLASSPMIIPDATGPDVFAIQTLMGIDQETLNAYQSYSAFEMALSSMLSGTSKVVRVLALGQFDATANTFTATKIAVIVR